jgi:ATP-dependent protease HslVU (ClpYQ) peptidase subunit
MSVRGAAAFAAGSGERYALGAMAMGATPEQAVQVAAGFCRYTGGDITVLRR